MPAEDLVFRIVGHAAAPYDDLWGVRPYFCPSCGQLVVSEYCTSICDDGIWGAYHSHDDALAKAQIIEAAPDCFSCTLRAARRNYLRKLAVYKKDKRKQAVSHERCPRGNEG